MRGYYDDLSLEIMNLMPFYQEPYSTAGCISIPRTLDNAS